MCLPFKDLAERTLETGEHAGYTWEIVKNGRGIRCGYVRVYPGHPWYGESPDADVHGGITFHEHGTACPTHDEKAEWWVGFDCDHYMDAPDRELMSDEYKEYYRTNGYDRYGTDGTVWSQYAVREECKSLCEQAARASHKALLSDMRRKA